MSFFAYDRLGNPIQNPSEQQMRDMLASLAVQDNEHPDVSLNHASGWCLSAFGSGLLVWENVEEGNGPWHMRSVAPEQVLRLWLALAA